MNHPETKIVLPEPLVIMKVADTCRNARMRPDTDYTRKGRNIKKRDLVCRSFSNHLPCFPYDGIC
ncbi:MAG: hypothetical protein C4522_13975 [Desulfobacteraceae bacterium]|nr:MAG: hypothetical protein C4522_13975 [Desulfobacteraceae bacterium]